MGEAFNRRSLSLLQAWPKPYCVSSLRCLNKKISFPWKTRSVRKWRQMTKGSAENSILSGDDRVNERSTADFCEDFFKAKLTSAREVGLSLCPKYLIPGFGVICAFSPPYFSRNLRWKPEIETRVYFQNRKCRTLINKKAYSFWPRSWVITLLEEKRKSLKGFDNRHVFLVRQFFSAKYGTIIA